MAFGRIDLRIYECKSCNEKWIVLENYCRHCIKCGSTNIIKTTDNNYYSLMDNRTNLLVD
jgi:hypothetical protein